MSNESLDSLFEAQKEFQTYHVHDIPHDNVKWFQYHMTAMVEELGEVLKADKRWKTVRNTRFVREEKLEELADVYITLLNMTMWSGFTSEELEQSVMKKIKENKERCKGNV